jgi:hypothetical protein
MNRQMASGTTQLLNGSAARPLTAAGAGAGGNGHLAPALSAARAALAAAGTLRSCRTRAQLRLLTTGLRQYRGCAAVRDFLDEHGTGR